MIRINLLPPEYAAAQARKEQRIILGAAGSFFVVVLFSFWVLQTRRAAALEQKIQQAEAELKRYQLVISQIDQLEGDKQRFMAKRDVIQNLNKSRLIYPVLFEDFLPLVPSDVSVTSFQIVEQGGNLKLTMNSSALSNYALASWLTNLQQSQHFSSIDLGAISYTNTGEGSTQTLTFVLSCIYQHKGPFPLSGI